LEKEGGGFAQFRGLGGVSGRVGGGIQVGGGGGNTEQEEAGACGLADGGVAVGEEGGEFGNVVGVVGGGELVDARLGGGGLGGDGNGGRWGNCVGREARWWVDQFPEGGWR
jgi:hypothetical protein